MHRERRVWKREERGDSEWIRKRKVDTKKIKKRGREKRGSEEKEERRGGMRTLVTGE